MSLIRTCLKDMIGGVGIDLLPWRATRNKGWKRRGVGQKERMEISRRGDRRDGMEVKRKKVKTRRGWDRQREKGGNRLVHMLKQTYSLTGSIPPFHFQEEVDQVGATSSPCVNEEKTKKAMIERDAPGETERREKTS